MAQTTDDRVRPGDLAPRRRRGTDRDRPLGRALLQVASAWTPALVTAAMIAYGVTDGLDAGDAVRATAVVLLLQVLPGAIVWRSVRPAHGWWLEDVAMGFAVGSVLAIGVQVVAGLLDSALVSWATLLPALVLLAVPATRRRVLSRTTSPLPLWFAPALAGIIALYVGQLRGYFRLVPMEWTGARTPHVDAYLHLALSAQLAHRGPTTFPWVQSEALGYHWFSHAWVAQVGVASGAELDGVLFRFMPALMPVVVAAAVAVAAVRLTGHAWTGPVAALLAMWGGDLNVFGKVNPGLPLAPLSPSLALAAPMLVAAVVLLGLRWRRESGPGAVVVLLLLAVGAAGTKGSTVPLLVAGLALAAVAMLLFDRRRVLPVLGDFALMVASLLFALVFVFRGSGAGLHLGPADSANENVYALWLGTIQGPVAVTFVVVMVIVGVVSRGVGAALLAFTPETRRDPMSWLLIGVTGAGACAAALFGHPGWSQHYFARSADPIMVLGTVAGLVVLARWVGARDRGRLLVVGGAAGVALVTLPTALLGPLLPGGIRTAAVMVGIGVVVLVLAAAAGWGRPRLVAARLGAGAVVLAVLTGGLVSNQGALLAPPPDALAPVTADRPLATTRGQIDAARWIRDHSGVDDVVMTNRHCTTPEDPYDGCDSRRWMVAGFSERQMLVEGWTAVPRSAEEAPDGRDSITVAYWDQPLLRLNDGFIERPTQAAADELVRRGVRWVFVDHTRPYADTLEPFARLRHQEPGVDVYELPRS